MITPDEAKALLDQAYQGPCIGTDGHHSYELISTRSMVVLESAFPLFNAAPDLAKLVAGMRYEYAVRVGVGHWLREDDAGELALTIDPTRAIRHYQQRIMEALAATAAVKFEQQFHVVRRLVSDEEVVS